MYEAYPPDLEVPTLEYVLAVLRDQHQLCCDLDPTGIRDAELTLDMSLRDWAAAHGATAPDWLWHQLNDRFFDAFPVSPGCWRIERPMTEWQAFFRGGNERPLRDLCEVIAQHAFRPRLRAVEFTGKPCRSAGAFLTICTLLSQADVDMRGVAPSTPLSAYARRYAEVFLDEIPRLAPGALSGVRVRGSTSAWPGLLHSAGCLCILLSFCGVLPLMVVFARSLPLFFPLLAYVFVFVAGMALSHYAASLDRPDAVSFGELKTFGQLAERVAAFDAWNAARGS